VVAVGVVNLVGCGCGLVVVVVVGLGVGLVLWVVGLLPDWLWVGGLLWWVGLSRVGKRGQLPEQVGLVSKGGCFWVSDFH